MVNNYESEIVEFNKNFVNYKESKIVIYGIGRMTLTLLEGQKGFNIIGLLDKDTTNYGKNINGIKVLSIEEAEEKADLIIINTSASYWEIIFERLKNVKIPVFYRNGERAQKENEDNQNNDYWKTNYKSIKEQIDVADVVAFDFFDTLFGRKTLSPSDVFTYVEKEIEQRYGYKNYAELRRRVIAGIDKYYSIYNIYENIAKISGWDIEIVPRLIEIELDIERQIIFSRDEMMELLRDSIKSGKDVYIVSDMYFPRTFFQDLLIKESIHLDDSNIYISCERKKEKADGELWQDLFNGIGRNKRILCIGDNPKSDISIPKEIDEGVVAVQIGSPSQLLMWSTIKGISSCLISKEANAIMGLINSVLFANPFALGLRNGKIFIDTPEVLGYVVFGPILLTFNKWLQDSVANNGISELIFMSRDGYFLQPLYEEYIKDKNSAVRTKYIGISRQLAMISSIETESDLIDFIKMPYSGSTKELLQDRFCINADPDETISLEDVIESVRDQRELGVRIWDYVKKVQRDYIEYIESNEISDTGAIVDIGYYGNNQKYLSKHLKKNINGFYMVANLDESNLNFKRQKMMACFQTSDDSKALKSSVYNKLLFLESFLTAPYGMVYEVGPDGKFNCKEGRRNQKSFKSKETIFEGVKRFIRDYKELYDGYGFAIDIGFCQTWYDYCFSSKVELSYEVKNSFYNDNAFMNRFDNSLFE